MRNTLLGILLIIVTPISANALTEQQELCLSISKLAKVVMEARQENLSVIDVYDRMEGVAFESDSQREMVEAFVEDAYSKPLELTEEKKISAINGYTNSWFAICSNYIEEEM